MSGAHESFRQERIERPWSSNEVLLFVLSMTYTSFQMSLHAPSAFTNFVTTRKFVFFSAEISAHGCSLFNFAIGFPFFP